MNHTPTDILLKTFRTLSSRCTDFERTESQLPKLIEIIYDDETLTSDDRVALGEIVTKAYETYYEAQFTKGL